MKIPIWFRVYAIAVAVAVVALFWFANQEKESGKVRDVSLSGSQMPSAASKDAWNCKSNCKDIVWKGVTVVEIWADPKNEAQYLMRGELHRALVNATWAPMNQRDYKGGIDGVPPANLYKVTVQSVGGMYLLDCIVHGQYRSAKADSVEESMRFITACRPPS